MKKSITTTIAFLTLSFTFAQQITVEEIYDNYIEAIGGKERLNNIVNQMTISTSNSSVSSEAWSTNSQTMVIDFIDYDAQQTANITKNYPSSLNGNKTSYTRRLTANGKMTIILPDGQKIESSFPEQFPDFMDTTVPLGSKILPNKTFNDKEVYVVNYEQEIAGIKQNVYEYFDIASGLKIGSKNNSETTKDNETSALSTSISTSSTSVNSTITSFEYKKMNGFLYPYKIKANSYMEIIITTIEPSVSELASFVVKVDENKVDEKYKQKEVNTKTTKSHSEWETEILAVEFNIDTEDFKQNCFQNPEACFEKYEKK